MSPSRLLPGVDVPWVTRWSDERMAGVIRCPELGGRLAIAQESRPGSGKPVYSENHLPRQRSSALRDLCPMCGRATPPEDRWSLTARRTNARSLRERGLGHLIPGGMPDAQALLNAGSIAPLHKDCATRSSRECPHLRSSPVTELTAFPARTLRVPLTVEAREPAPGHAVLVAPPRSAAVVGFVQIIGVFD